MCAMSLRFAQTHCFGDVPAVAGTHVNLKHEQEMPLTRHLRNIFRSRDQQAASLSFNFGELDVTAERSGQDVIQVR